MQGNILSNKEKKVDRLLLYLILSLALRPCEAKLLDIENF